MPPPVGLRDHAGIADEEAAGELPAAQVFLDPGHRGDVDRVAGKHPVAHREAVAGHRHADHDLRCIATAVLAVTALAGRGVDLLARQSAAVNLAVPVALIFLVGFEVQRGGVVEDHLDVEIEQVGDPVEDGLLDRFLVRLQKVHGAVELVQLQSLRPVDMRVFLEPLFMAVEFRDRGAGTVGDQGEQGALDIEAEMPRVGLLPHDGVDAELLPDGFEDVEVAVGPGADQAPVATGSDDLFRRATAQDALGQPAQTLDDVGIVGAPAVMHDAGLRSPLAGIPDVLRQLQVGDDAAIGPPLFALAQVHGLYRSGLQGRQSTIHVSRLLATWRPETRAVTGGG